jgi:hypothetical protein
MEHWLVPSAYSAGGPFYLGESNRLLATFEDFFTRGKRHDELVSADLACGKVVVLTLGPERLILAFNDGRQAQRVALTQKETPGGAQARLFFENAALPRPEKMEVTIPAEYLVAIHCGPPVRPGEPAGRP